MGCHNTSFLYIPCMFVDDLCLPLWSIMNTHKQYSVYFENSKIAHDFYFDTFLVCFKIWATDAQILQQMTYRRATVPAWECFFSMWNDCNAIAIL